MIQNLQQKGEIIQKEQWEEQQWGFVGEQRLFLQRCGAGRRREFTIAKQRYHGNIVVSQDGA